MRIRGGYFSKAVPAKPVWDILPDTLAFIAPTAGAYLLLDGAGVCIYVGQSVNVLRRITDHRLVNFEDARMIHCDDPKERLLLESRLIRRLQPELNTYAGNAAAVARAEPTADDATQVAHFNAWSESQRANARLDCDGSTIAHTSEKGSADAPE